VDATQFIIVIHNINVLLLNTNRPWSFGISLKYYHLTYTAGQPITKITKAVIAAGRITKTENGECRE
jgi:hypothetical protein